MTAIIILLILAFALSSWAKIINGLAKWMQTTPLNDKIRAWARRVFARKGK